MGERGYQFTLLMPQQMRRELKLLAVDREVSASDLVRTAVEEYLARERAKQQAQEDGHLAKGRGH